MASPGAASVSELVKDGIKAARAGQRAEARELLMAAVDQDDTHCQAWLWLSSVMDSLEDKQICLENVLALDPDNAMAQKGLAMIHSRTPSTAMPIVQQAEETLYEAEAHDMDASVDEPDEVESSSSLYVEDYDNDEDDDDDQSYLLTANADHVARQSEGLSELPPLADLEDEYLCPYCAHKTKPKDSRCKQCRKKLWVEIRQKEWSPLFIMAFAIQGFNTLVVFGLMIAGGFLVQRLMTDMLASAAEAPSLDAGTASLIFYLCFSPILLFQVGILAGLYFRWKPVYYLYLANAGLNLVFATAGFFTGAWFAAIFNVPIALGMLYIVFQIESDFFGESRRIVFKPDRDVNRFDYAMKSGHKYAKEQAWALAALHFRWAVGSKQDDFDANMALTVAYLKMKWFNEAEMVLNHAEKKHPGDLKIQKLREDIVDLRKRFKPAKSGSKYRRLKPSSS